MIERLTKKEDITNQLAGMEDEKLIEFVARRRKHSRALRFIYNGTLWTGRLSIATTIAGALFHQTGVIEPSFISFLASAGVGVSIDKVQRKFIQKLDMAENETLVRGSEVKEKELATSVS